MRGSRSPEPPSPTRHDDERPARRQHQVGGDRGDLGAAEVLLEPADADGVGPSVALVGSALRAVQAAAELGARVPAAAGRRLARAPMLRMSRRRIQATTALEGTKMWDFG